MKPRRGLKPRIVFVHGRGAKPREAIERACVTQCLNHALERVDAKPIEPAQVAVAYTRHLFTDAMEPDDEYTQAIAEHMHRPTHTFNREAYLAMRSRFDFRAWRDEASAHLSGWIAKAAGARRVVAQFAPEMLRYVDEPELRVEVQNILRNACGCDQSPTEPENVLLIAHSLGSVYALDALMAGSLRRAKITLVTIGSPLADASVLELLSELFNVETPVPVLRWMNLGAEDDFVSHTRELAPLYWCEDGRTIEDHLVENFFIHPKYGPNPHKSYGYLDHPRMGEILQAFLTKS